MRVHHQHADNKSTIIVVAMGGFLVFQIHWMCLDLGFFGWKEKDREKVGNNLDMFEYFFPDGK